MTQSPQFLRKRTELFSGKANWQLRMLRSGKGARKGRGSDWVKVGGCPAPGAPTCVLQLLVPIHRQDDQDVAQDVHHDSEDEDEGECEGQPRGSWPRVPAATGRLLRGVEQRAAVAFQGPARCAPRPPSHGAARQATPAPQSLRVATCLAPRGPLASTLHP